MLLCFLVWYGLFVDFLLGVQFEVVVWCLWWLVEVILVGDLDFVGILGWDQVVVLLQYLVEGMYGGFQGGL